MKKMLKTIARKNVNTVLDAVGFELTRKNAPFVDYRGYIPCNETVAEAQAAGMSVGDYIDARYNKPGATQETIDQMAALGVFNTQIGRVCEIGPGSGRYLEKIIKRCRPNYYEIYETSTDWEKWLVKSYPLLAQPTDGRSLTATPAGSIDLVHAHKVLPGQPSLTICRYYSEMARVAAGGGKIVFDIVTEECLAEPVLARWFETESGYQHYPCMMAKQYTIDFFAQRDCVFDGSFLVPMEPGLTECFVFTKQ
jgi:hypothetical protein